MTFDDVINEVKGFRESYGDDICTDPVLNGYNIARYTFQAGDSCGYVQEYDLDNGRERHCGLGNGSFWTEWE